MKLTTATFVCILSIAATSAADSVKDLNTPWKFPVIESAEQWSARAAAIRENCLASCGLWPMPAKSELNARVFDRVERQGYTIEKVSLETSPGFFLAGNLYRPLGKGAGPFPAILNPHGHWSNGRMADTELGSIAARCINFARQGMIAFSYDMVGYNDTRQVDHKFAANPTNQLWNISLMGLQTWNSIRALDFLESLPDVDKKRLACTGESGGGTQTFMLGAIDDRLAAQAPIVMVSHSMQGGCLCENAPGLRVNHSNIEIAAQPAPRPQILVAATGDWTKMTMTMEGPAIEGIYKLLKAEEKFDYQIFNYDHNYNKPSREAVYEFFGKWLLGASDPATLKEQPYTKEPDTNLLVFAQGKLPDGALNETALIQQIVQYFRDQLEELRPVDQGSLKNWRTVAEPLWRNLLQLPAEPLPDFEGEKVRVSARSNDRNYVLLIDVGHSPTLQGGLGAKTHTALLQFFAPEERHTNQFANYYNTYNRTLLQKNAAYLKFAAEQMRARYPGKKLVFYADHKANPAMLAGAALADVVIADLSEFDESRDERLLQNDIFFPGYRRLGGLQSVLAMLAPKPMLLFGVDRSKVNLSWLEPLYAGLGAPDRLTIKDSAASHAEVSSWLDKNQQNF